MTRESVDVRVQRDQNHPEQVMLLAKDGELFKRLLTMQWQESIALGQLLISTGRRAEEYAKANRQIAQEALLIRASGGRLSMVSDANLFHAAMQEAQWGSVPRKIIQGMPSVPSGRHVGTPTITKSIGEDYNV